MEQEEEDRLLLNSLGVTSANPEDIERNILQEAKNDFEGRSEAGECIEEQSLYEDQGACALSTRVKLLNRLRALDFEIEAVAANVEQIRTIAKNENSATDSEEEGDGAGKDAVRDSVKNLSLQHALASDRLESLKRRKADLQREFNEWNSENAVEGTPNDSLLVNLVSEEQKCKRKLKGKKIIRKDAKKKHKAVSFDDDVDFEAVLDAASAGFVETERDELVRRGILTPFHKLEGFERRLQQPASSSQHPSLEDVNKDLASDSIAKTAQSIKEASQARRTTKLLDSEELPKLDAPTRPFRRLQPPLKLGASNARNKKNEKNKLSRRKRPLPNKKWRKVSSHEDELMARTDACDGSFSNEEENEEEGEEADIKEPDFVILEGGLKIPESIFSQLFDYQKVGVQWLWELHCQRAGGIIGDEMGLGKTIQVICFLGGLHFSKMYKPSIVICPLTLLRQWRREVRKWYPRFHVEILHDSAYDPDISKKQAKCDKSDDDSDCSLDNENERNTSQKTPKKWNSLINHVVKSESGLLITTYEQLRRLGEKLLDIQWGYAILDEGHRIRNPNAEITLLCKQLQTVHRIIMTGAPIQNKLTELWSLFDFVFPGKLGVLPVFESEFAVPISVGGYANATPLQVSTAYRCAVVLRDLIMPYLLRRMKADVNAQLPKKTEHVLFCSLTPEQLSAYRAFLASSEVEQIFDGNRNSLYGIDVMRKICNHPDLLEREHSANHKDYGNPERSGKMKVVAQVLKVWKDQGHRVLLFSQTQQMLDILENFLSASGYTYRRMDGLTAVKQRMVLIDEFNESDHVFIFILTTKVGGLGTNLIGANRVIIFDPDWNPSTDMQARERAWRIGQKRDVTVYRLITRGTIEEKVYHRQIYKHFLTNKILKNPQQRRFFKARDLKDLFTLQENEECGSTETSNIFSQLSGDINVGVLNDTNEEQESADASRTNSCLHGASSSIKEKAEQSDGEVDEEASVLKSLFDAHGIHSAMNHDLIMNANDEEKMRLEEQASQVAQKAAEALRRSRVLCSQENISVPTWTGRSGAAGGPSSARRMFGSTVNSQLLSSAKSVEQSFNGGTSKLRPLAAGASSGKVLSSAELLSKIRGTNERAALDGFDHQLGMNSTSNHRVQHSADGSSIAPNKADVLVDRLCTYIQLSGGSATSATIVSHFKDKIPSADLALFKNLLKEIAILKKDSDGSRWVLKPEYQPRL